MVLAFYLVKIFSITYYVINIDYNNKKNNVKCMRIIVFNHLMSIPLK